MERFAVYIGRFQPYHLGHASVVKRLVQEYGPHSACIIIGSAHTYRTAENPLTLAERRQIMADVPLPIEWVCDIAGDDAAWAKQVQNAVTTRFGKTITPDMLDVIIGDESSIPWAKQVGTPKLWSRESAEYPGVSATLVRHTWAQGGDISIFLPPHSIAPKLLAQTQETPPFDMHPNKPTWVLLALGSNVGESKTTIAQAIELLGEYMQDIRTAPFYVSHATLYTDQPDFVNTVITGYTSLSPQELLLAAQRIEEQLGRIRRFRYGPREIDIDIIFYGSLVGASDVLTIPHIGAATRDFVLRPACDIVPDYVHPAMGVPLHILLERIPVSYVSIFPKQ